MTRRSCQRCSGTGLDDHAVNAYLMLYEPDQLIARAGQGVRQGFANAGPLPN